MGRLKKLALAVGIGLVALCAIIASLDRKPADPVRSGVSGSVLSTVKPAATTAPTSTPSLIAPTNSPIPTQEIPPTAVPPTLAGETTAEATDTPTMQPTVLVPETTEGLVSILLEPGDLPPEWHLDDEFFDDGPVDYDGPAPVAMVNTGLIKGEARLSSGGVAVYLFATENDAIRAFDGRSDIVTRNIDAGAKVLHPPYGQRSMLAPGFGDVFGLDQLVFQRCRVVVEMQIGLRANGVLVGQYAPRLDSRLTPTACKD
jgi:hypothetical protein